MPYKLVRDEAKLGEKSGDSLKNSNLLDKESKHFLGNVL